MKPRILHISADFPDVIQPAKTRAIAGLVEGTADSFNHLVFSLNRQNGLAGFLTPGRLLECRHASSVLAIRYVAPPATFTVASPMMRLTAELIHQLTLADFKPDLIQAHKLTVEGKIAQQLAERLGVPFVLTLQGNTDQKLLQRRPDRLPSARRIWREAKAIMAFAPWTASWASERLGKRPSEASIIPCVLPYDEVIPPKIRDHLVRTAFHLEFWRNKNVITLLQAIARLASKFPEVRLEIAGGGSAAAYNAISAQVRHLGLENRVSLVGPIAPDAIQEWFNGAAAFALPTRRESYGMVFAESLLGGTPVVYPRNAAIEGILQHKRFARGVNAHDADELKEALAELLTNQQEIKTELAAAQHSGELNLFKREEVLYAYAQFLTRACS
jgi:glycosyltransferase involved in cell wall biosynthesis